MPKKRSTKSTKRVSKVINDTPIVFTAVNNPVDAGIMPNWQTSGRNMAGNSYWIPTKKILKEFKNIVPELKKLGVIFDSTNPVSSLEIDRGKKAVNELGFELVIMEIKSIDQLSIAVDTLLAKKVEALWIPIDKLVYENIDKIKPKTDAAKIPLLSSSHNGVKEGALFGETVNFYTLGKLSVTIAVKILVDGVVPKDISIGTMNKHIQMINLITAKNMGYDIPLDVLATADEIIKK